MKFYIEIGLGYKANAGYIRECFHDDDRMPSLVAQEFDDIAAERGVRASLNVRTSAAIISVDDLAKLPEHVPAGIYLREWFDEAFENVGIRWMNDEL